MSDAAHFPPGDNPITWEEVCALADEGKLPIVAVDEDSVALLWWEPAPGHEHTMYYATGVGRAVFAITAAVHVRARYGMAA